jgi:hypothetical protein
MGYLYWREKHVATGGADVIPGTRSFPAGPVISERFAWQGFQVGFRNVLRFGPDFAFTSRVMFLPILDFKEEDVHYLRDDLRKDPSFIDRATGGFGVTADLRFTYRLWRCLFLDLGYRIWDATSAKGSTTVRTTEGDLVTPFNQGHTLRQGLLVGLSAEF